MDRAELEGIVRSILPQFMGADFAGDPTQLMQSLILKATQ
jgi:hypothetical protein